MGTVESTASSMIEGQLEQKLPWKAPVLKRLRATDAENASGPTPDDPVNKS